MVSSLPLLSCESSVSVKENPDRKKKKKKKSNKRKNKVKSTDQIKESKNLFETSFKPM